MNPNAPLDPESRRQMDIIELRTAVEELKKDKKAGDTVFQIIDKKLVEIELRIKTLEEARQRQIAFNTEVSNRLAKLEKPVEIKKPEVKEIKFKWPWQK